MRVRKTRSMEVRAILILITGQRSQAIIFVVYIKKLDITETIGHNPI